MNLLAYDPYVRVRVANRPREEQDLILGLGYVF